MSVVTNIDSPRRMVEFVLAGLPWAALLIDQQGYIHAANDLALHLLQADPVALLKQQLDDLTTASSLDTLQSLLDAAQSDGSATGRLVFAVDAAARVCVLQSLDLPFEGRTAGYRRSVATTLEAQRSLLVVSVRDEATHQTQLVTAFSAAAAACLSAADQTDFYRHLDHLCASLHLSGAVAVYHDQRITCAWTSTPLTATVRTAVERQLGLTLPDLLAQTLHSLELSDTPQIVSIAEVCELRAHTSSRRIFQLALLKLIWGHIGIMLPLVAQGQLVGAIFLTGPHLQAADAELLQPFSQLLGLGLERLVQQSLISADQQSTTLLLQANQALTAATKLNEVLRVICEQALALTSATTSAVLMPEPDAEHLRCIMAVGSYSDLLLGYRSKLSNTISGLVFDRQHSYIVQTVQDEPQIDSIMKRLMPQYSGIFLPLLIQQRVVGVLAVGHPQSGYFNGQQTHGLVQFSVNAAIAIENAQLHESIRLSEERYRTLFQNALEIVLTLDLDGRIVAWNRAALQFLGVSPAELRGGMLSLYDLLTPATALRVREMQSQTLEGLPPLPVEIELQRPDGQPAVVEVTMQLFQEYGQLSGVYIIGRDMTERRRQQRALTDQVAQLTALHKLSTALNASLDRDAILQRAAEAIAHANRFECVGIYLPYPCEQYLTMVAATGMHEPLRFHVRRVGPGTQIWETWRLGQVSTATTSQLTPLAQTLFGDIGVVSHTFVPLISTSRILGVLAIGRVGVESFAASDFQVLQTMAAQIAQSLENIKLYAAVEQSAARYRDLYENANDFIGTLAIDGRVLSLNRAALRFFGYTTDDLPRLTLGDLLPPSEHPVAETLELLHQSKMPANGLELRVLRSDRSTAIVEIRSRLVLDGDEPTAIHFIARDTTERHQLEAQVRQGEKLAALGQLVAGAAHELNNPLAVVLGTTQLLLRDPSATHLNDDVRNIESAAQRAKQIVSQMLTFAREQEDVRGPVDVLLLIERVAQSSRSRLEQGQIALRVQLPSELPSVWGDAYQLEQVLDNLLHNAAQALLDNAQPLRQISIIASTNDTRVRICVVDNGPGIAPQVLPRIFDPFFTTKEVGHGTGLGLSLVYGIVDKHGGTIYAESVIGHGATFTVELPANHTPAGHTSPALISGPTNSTILVVEDEPDVRAVVERALSQHGYTVDAVDSAETALVRAGSKRYDLVITDLRMPGMSGKELFEQMHATQPQLNWVFITGDTMSTSSDVLLNQSGIPFLAKPFTLEELWDAVATSIIGRPKLPTSSAA